MAKNYQVPFELLLVPGQLAFPRRLVSLVLLFLSLLPSQAQSSDSLKVINRSIMLGVGSTNLLDTYLSQEHFSGTGLSFLVSIERQRPYKRLSTIIEHEADLSIVRDRANSKKELEGAYNFYWGKLYGWQLLDDRLKLQAGAVVNASLGFIYNTSNSNNPAQARAHINIMPTGVVNYHFTLFNRPIKARYEANLPLVGIMFSPNYGQSYYEIFSRGNYDHNIVPTTFISAPEWRHQLTIDAVLGKKFTLRLGYLGNMQQYKVNHLRQHVYTHRFIIGFTRSFTLLMKN